jgi:hypothetical protein
MRVVLVRRDFYFKKIILFSEIDHRHKADADAGCIDAPFLS